MFSGIGTVEILIILFIVLILFGAKRLPELAKGLGKGISEFKKASNDIKDEVIHTKKDGSYIINASISILKFNEKFDNIIKSDYESLAGYIINEIGRIPKKREMFFLSIGQVKVIKASLRKIEIIQLFVNK